MVAALVHPTCCCWIGEQADAAAIHHSRDLYKAGEGSFSLEARGGRIYLVCTVPHFGNKAAKR
jgi:hypothetical protein